METPFDVRDKSLRGGDYGSAEHYVRLLDAYDAALCELFASSRAGAHRYVPLHIGYASKVLIKLCTHAGALMRGLPKSRWGNTECEFWAFSEFAPHCRSIFETQLLFWYLLKTPLNEDELKARVNVMHLNDCCGRIKMLKEIWSANEQATYVAQAEELRDRLSTNNWFVALPPKLQGRLLSGEYLTISTRDELLAEVGWDRREFYLLWHTLSQYIHALPVSFYRMESSGRGTGVENDADRGHLCLMLELCTQAVSKCTDRWVEIFPDVAAVRQGVKSKFSPGPISNRP